MGFDIDKWYLRKLQGEIIVRYMGDITPDKFTEILEVIESNLNLKKVNNQTRKKVYNVFVECIQNLFHHVDVPPDNTIKAGQRFGVIILARDNYFYRVSTGNFIHFSKVNTIRDRIDQINSLSDEELRSLYREILGNEGISFKGGGGLGMLDMVRKTGNKLEYSIYPHDKDFVFFAIDVYIS